MYFINREEGPETGGLPFKCTRRVNHGPRCNRIATSLSLLEPPNNHFAEDGHIALRGELGHHRFDTVRFGLPRVLNNSDPLSFESQPLAWIEINRFWRTRERRCLSSRWILFAVFRIKRNDNKISFPGSKTYLIEPGNICILERQSDLSRIRIGGNNTYLLNMYVYRLLSKLRNVF